MERVVHRARATSKTVSVATETSKISTTLTGCVAKAEKLTFSVRLSIIHLARCSATMPISTKAVISEYTAVIKHG